MRFLDQHIFTILFKIQLQSLPRAGVVVSFEWYGKSKPHVIPAKAGIHPANLWRCAVYRLDSRFRGNDVWFDMDPRPNDTTTARRVGLTSRLVYG